MLKVKHLIAAAVIIAPFMVGFSLDEVNPIENDPPVEFEAVEICVPWVYINGEKQWYGWVDEYGNDWHPSVQWIHWIQEQDVYIESPEHVKKLLTDFKKLRLIYDLSRQHSFNPEVMLAQHILETGWARKNEGNAGFGIKGGGQKFVTTEYLTTEQLKAWKKPILSKVKVMPDVLGALWEIKTEDTFRAYGSWEESFEDYASLRSRLEIYNTKGLGNEDALKKIARNYATSPVYAKTLSNIIAQYHLSHINEIAKSFLNN